MLFTWQRPAKAVCPIQTVQTEHGWMIHREGSLWDAKDAAYHLENMLTSKWESHASYIKDGPQYFDELHKQQKHSPLICFTMLIYA